MASEPEALGPLAGLWQLALSAEADNTGVDPSLVIDFVRHNLIGALSLFVSSPGKTRATIPVIGPTGLESNAFNPEQISGRIFPAQRKTLPLSKPGKPKLAGFVRTLPIKTVISNQTGPKPAPHVHTLISSCLKVDFAPVVNPALLAGRLGHFLQNWHRITNDPTILEMIQGYKLEFTSTPVQSTVRRPLQFSCSETEKIDLEISALLEKEALHVVKPVCDQFISNLFLVPGREISPCDQSKGSEHIPSVRSFQNGGYPPTSRFTPASRLAGKDRPEGCVLRDSYLEESSEVPSVSLDRHTSRVCVPSLRAFVPTQQLEFLGFLVNSRDMTLLLPDCKVEAIKAHCLCLLARQDVSVWELSKLIGKLTASIQAIFPAPLHYRSLQHLKHQALAQQKGFDATIALSSEAREELHWWSAHLDAWNGRALLRPAPDLIIETNASGRAGGQYARV